MPDPTLLLPGPPQLGFPVPSLHRAWLAAQGSEEAEHTLGYFLAP